MARFKTWRELCLEPRWQKRRLEVFERDGWECIKCGTSEKTLHAHHLWYGSIHDKQAGQFRRRFPWEYQVNDLATLCADCHEEQRNEITADMASDLVQILKQNGLLVTDLASIAVWLVNSGTRPRRDKVLSAFRQLTTDND